MIPITLTKLIKTSNFSVQYYLSEIFNYRSFLTLIQMIQINNFINAHELSTTYNCMDRRLHVHYIDSTLSDLSSR